MERDDRRETGKLWAGTATAGVGLVIAALYLAAATLLEARGLDSTLGEVVGAREVETETGRRPELLVGYRTAGGDTMMFAEATGLFAPAVGDRVTVWYTEAPAPRALIARQRLAWPSLLLPAGLVLSSFGLWCLRRARRSAAAELGCELEDL